MNILHTSITVKVMDDSIRFYRDIIGLKLINRHEIPENNAEIAFLTDESSSHAIELTYWRDKKDYVEGDQLDHLAFSVENVGKTISEFRAKGVEIAKEPYSLKVSKSRLAFIKDPNGIWIELIENKKR